MDLDGKIQCFCFVDGLNEQVVASALTFRCSFFSPDICSFLVGRKRKHEFSCRLPN